MGDHSVSSSQTRPESAGIIQVIYQDNDIICIDKPPGMLTHAHQFDRGTPTVQAVLGKRLGKRVMTVHRLDRMTTGALLLALSSDAARHLSRQFATRTIAKRYLALVRGHTADDRIIDSDLRVGSGEPEAATTMMKTLSRGVVREPVSCYDEAWFSLVEATTMTGRRHQVRRHLHAIDHPVVGDNRHGDKSYNRWAAERFGERHLYLRATEISFRRPDDDTLMTIYLGIPEIWKRALQTCVPEFDYAETLPAAPRVVTMQRSN